MIRHIVRGLLFWTTLYICNKFQQSINRNFNDKNKTQQPYISLFYVVI